MGSSTCTETRWATGTTSIPTIIAMTWPGTNIKLALNGDMRRTICKHCVAKNTKPIKKARLIRLMATEPLKVLLRNSVRSIKGTGSRSWRRTNSQPVAVPMAKAARAKPSTPSLAMCLMP
ncbi:hypothetical protein D3C77_665910 [compost metagenome]